MKRRQFVRGAFTAMPVAAMPWSAVFAAIDAAPPGDVEAVTGAGREVLLRGSEVQDFARRLRGDLLLRNSAGYDTARKVWNGAFDRHPALIARCAGAADVMQAVQFAAAHQLLVAVRGGGHSLSGQSVCERGLVIDLSQMNGVRVDTARRTATIEGGALLGALDRETLPLGLATTAGTVSHTGVGGLTLGGGFGRLARRFGLACDNVRSVDIVPASAKFITASSRQNSDLFWGVRGGGGNFGVVTSFEFQLHRVDPVMLGGDLVYSFADAPAVLKFLTEYCPVVRDEANLDGALVSLPNGQKMMSVNVCFSGSLADGEKVIEPLRKIRKPVVDTVKPTPYVELQSSADASSPHGRRYYIKAGFIHRGDDAYVETMVDAIATANLPAIQVLTVVHGGGAIRRVKPTATAFAQRDSHYSSMVMAMWDDPAVAEAAVAWGRATWKRIEPFTRGFYVNELNADDSAQRVRDNYGPNLERLVALKTKFDPNNLFRMNANVTPRAP